MSNPNQIEIGDTVRVFMGFGADKNPPPNFFGVVLYLPQATGDCWHIRDMNGGLRYVQIFTEMQLELKASTRFP